MRGHITRGLVLVGLLTLAMTGCTATHQERVVMLEDINRHLSERLNKAQAELSEVEREQADLDARLVAALDEVDGLTTQLEQMPPPIEAAPGWTAVPGGAMIAIEGNILFQTGKATLRGEARRLLDAVASTINGEYADKDVVVVGHTDNQPIKKSGWKDNFQLSTERALSVARYLEDHGVNPRRLVSAGCGQHRPRVPNDSAANRTSNRRVEIFAIDAFAAQP